MDLAVIGAGNVGGGIGRAWARAGHQVTFGVTRPDADHAKLTDGLPQGVEVRVASVPEAAAHADVVLLATPWPAVRAVIDSAAGLDGLTVIDATNPLLADFSWLEDNYTVSGAERIAQWAPKASVFKAFNQTGAENLTDPSGYPATPVMFVCGDDNQRKPNVLALVTDAGFASVDAGPLRAARLLEPYAMLWIHLAHAQGLGRDFAFTLQRRQG